MSKETLSISQEENPEHRNALEEKYKEEEPLNPENIKDLYMLLPSMNSKKYLFNKYYSLDQFAYRMFLRHEIYPAG